MRQQLNNLPIEYYGLSISNGHIVNEKEYFYWDGRELPFPQYLDKYLKPFDYAIRKNGFDYSVSCFIKSVSVNLINDLRRYLINEGLEINKDVFPKEMWTITDLDNNSHYDPIISFKYCNKRISGISFYVSALKDKAKMLDYLSIVNEFIIRNKMPVLKQFVNTAIMEHWADLYLVSWDFELDGNRQNKVYIKIKDKAKFNTLLMETYPSMMIYIVKESFRLSEIAFYIGNDSELRYNLYFKPL